MLKTPLVSFRRVDLLWNKTELSTFHNSIRPLSQDQLFGTASWDVSPTEYLEEFFSGPPYQYKVLVASTGGHWTTETFPVQGGMAEITELFAAAVMGWSKQMAAALLKHPGHRVLGRAYVPGHQNCQWAEVGSLW